MIKPTLSHRNTTHRRDGAVLHTASTAAIPPLLARRLLRLQRGRERRLDRDERLVVVVVVRVHPAAARGHHSRPVPVLPRTTPLPPPPATKRGPAAPAPHRRGLVVDGRLDVVGVVHHPRPARVGARRGGERGGGPAGHRGQGVLLVLLRLMLVVLRPARGGVLAARVVGVGAAELVFLPGVVVYLLFLFGWCV